MNRVHIVIVLVISVLTGCVGPDSALEKSYQRDADKLRVQGVHSYCALVEEFHEKNGYYPLAKDTSRLPVALAITKKKEYRDPGLITEFESELSTVAGEKFRMLYDPQKVPVYAPRLFQYWTDGKNYSVSANLFAPTERTRPLEQYNHKYEVGSSENRSRRVWKYSELRKE